MNTSYENAPATKLLATHCAVCRRPLLDSLSVEIGMGPVCRERHGYNAEMNELPGCRDAANCIVHRIAAQPDNETLRLEGCVALRLMGFKVLPDRIEYRGKEAPKGELVTVTEYDLPALPAIRKYGKWLPAKPARKGFLVVAPYKPAAVEAFRRIEGRRWLADQKATFIPADARGALWQLLRTFYAGCRLESSHGESTIPAQLGAAS